MSDDTEYQYCMGKRCLTRRQAAEELNAAKGHHQHGHKKIPKRMYFHKFCGYWHLTSSVDEHPYRDKW